MNPRCRRASKRENSRTDYRPNAQRDQTPHPKRPVELLAGFFRSRDQCIDALGSQEFVHERVVGGRWWVVGLPTTYLPPPTTRGSEASSYLFLCPLDIFFTFFFMEPRATPAARLALGAAFLREARFNFLRSSLSVMFFVFILPVFPNIFRSSSSSRNHQ